MTKERQELGRSGEEIAADYLAQAGLKIIARNYRGYRGEIDIVATDTAIDLSSGNEAETLVFVEVRTRHASSRVGTAEESITHLKRDRLRTLAGSYLSENGYVQWPPLRFDVVAITYEPENIHINWIKGAF